MLSILLNRATKFFIPAAAERIAGQVVKLWRYPEKAMRSLGSRLRGNDEMMDIRSLFFPTFAFRLPNSSMLHALCPLGSQPITRNPQLVTRNPFFMPSLSPVILHFRDIFERRPHNRCTGSHQFLLGHSRYRRQGRPKN